MSCPGREGDEGEEGGGRGRVSLSCPGVSPACLGEGGEGEEGRELPVLSREGWGGRGMKGEGVGIPGLSRGGSGRGTTVLLGREGGYAFLSKGYPLPFL